MATEARSLRLTYERPLDRLSRYRPLLEGTRMLPLEGIKILDLSRLAPGPFSSMLLGDLGADVLLVEAPEGGKLAPAVAMRGDPERAAAYNILGRNKRSIVLNLREPDAREIFYQLADSADVVLEGFRPAS